MKYTKHPITLIIILALFATPVSADQPIRTVSSEQQTNRDNEKLTILQNEIKDADILVNATSVGMTPDIDHSLVPARLLHDKLVVFDIIGIPARTKLFQEAAAAGARTIAGLEMLVWQGALSFELWTGQSAPFELMHREAQKALQHEE